LEINPDGFLSADKEKLFTHYTYQRGSHSIWRFWERNFQRVVLQPI
jgi:hypothetical protein